MFVIRPRLSHFSWQSLLAAVPAVLWNQLDQCLCSHAHYCYPQVPLLSHKLFPPDECPSTTFLSLSQGSLFRSPGPTTKGTHVACCPALTILTHQWQPSSLNTMYSVITATKTEIKWTVYRPFTERISGGHKQESSGQQDSALGLLQGPMLIIKDAKWINDKRKEAKRVPLWWKSPAWHR